MTVPREQNALPGIWTADLSRSFYGNVNALSNKLKGNQSPRAPKNYRQSVPRAKEMKGYLLSYEEELHLADHIAFLAHVEEGVEYVSAAVLQEMSDPPGFTFRLASNQTPRSTVVNGIEKILGIVRDHAKAGKHRQQYQSQLFEEIVSFSEKRIYGRMRTHHWVKPEHFGKGKSRLPPLYVRIDRILEGIWGPDGQIIAEFASLRASVIALRDALEKVDQEDADDQANLLKDAILKSYDVSNQGSSKSLETHLQILGLDERIQASREVAEIDKLSNYWGICKDLIRLSRQPETRFHCQNLNLEICDAYPASQPPGAADLCFVHGEVQLIFFYEKYKNDLPPRAIGSSKSACFLCDLFIKHHGQFGISHSHMKLYPKWTIPDSSEWMNQHPQQRKRFRGMIRSMDNEICGLLNKNVYYHNAAMESRAHVLLLEQRSSIAASASTVTSISGVPRTPSLLAVRMSSSASSSSSTTVQQIGTAVAAHPSIYQLEDLPVTIDISPSTTFCELTAGLVSYFFDFEDIATTGMLCIADNPRSAEQQRGEKRVDVNTTGLSFDSSVCIQAEPGSRHLAFIVHADGRHELGVSVTWHEP
ncbi:hypothetical protein LOCC1_G000808 [Lachnellula occidentalis]|uniref:Uncharacterized protein n=1 Tax=Lachnellula occidentalis TaxID=215460 RepID=A0A8H8UKI9_9HELO|nr:hypothetical protein LOCC1_G000808 [Lachnellula occidentalis]